jgi:hypothetical protein
MLAPSSSDSAFNSTIRELAHRPTDPVSPTLSEFIRAIFSAGRAVESRLVLLFVVSQLFHLH